MRGNILTYFDIIFDAFMRSNAPGEDKARGIAGMADISWTEAR